MWKFFFWCCIRYFMVWFFVWYTDKSLFIFFVILKLVFAIFHHYFIFNQMIALQKLWKMFFISSKKLFSFSRYSSFCISVFPSFLPVSHCFTGWSNINLMVCDIINWLNKNLITHFVWYLGKEKRYDIETFSVDRVFKKTFLWKNHA